VKLRCRTAASKHCRAVREGRIRLIDASCDHEFFS